MPDAWYMKPDGEFDKKKGITLGYHVWDDRKRFREQFDMFEETFLKGLKASASRVGRRVTHVKYC
jgi:hypothetical protein